MSPDAAPAPRPLTPLLGNDELGRLELLRIQGFRRFTQRSAGEHRSRGGGRSIEFKDYRDYAPGDDIRFLDWGILARLRRPYVRLYHDEEEQQVVVLLDASASMGFYGKLERARQLVAAFGVMALHGGERVAVHAFGAADGVLRSLRVPRGRKGMLPLLRFVEGIAAGGAQALEHAAESLWKAHRGRGVLIVVSDFLTAGDLRPVLNRALGQGLEVMALQVLGGSELEPEVTEDLRLVDCESGDALDVTAGDELQAVYDDHLRAFQRGLDAACRTRNGRFLAVDARSPLRAILFDRLRRAGWVG
jgi:uncharacterized protein (DUF58 family)